MNNKNYFTKEVENLVTVAEKLAELSNRLPQVWAESHLACEGTMCNDEGYMALQKAIDAAVRITNKRAAAAMSEAMINAM